ncbi:MAG: SDR family oxidoreductase [Chloroflexi bacterium]|nr:SDR family oxidoreductase [Chloroflexota bacterium]
MARPMAGKVALVTGGSSGIGRVTALMFAREGARVVIQDLDAAGGEETVAAIRELGVESLFAQGDVTNRDDVQSVVSQTVAAYGRLDYAFNNAASLEGYRSKIHEYDEDDWDHTINVLLKGVWLGMKYQIRQMLEQGGGAIVNTSSIAGIVGGRNGSRAYVAAKHGVLGLTKTAAIEYGQQGIRINAVCPAQIHTPRMDRIMEIDPEFLERETPRHPVGRIGEPREVAEAVVWLCSDAASFVTGHALAVDGGYLAQ